MDPKDFASVTSRLQRELDQRSAEAPRSNLSAVKQALEAIERGDLESVFATAHPNVTFEIFAPQEFKFVRYAAGLPALKEAIAKNFAAVVDQRPEIQSVFAEGSTVVLFGREQGRIRETGTPYDLEFVERFTFDEGRLTSIRIIAAHVD